MQEIYVSTDVEADGPIPGPYSMLSFGSAAFTGGGELLSTFTANLELLEGAAGHPETMAWRQRQQEAWDRTRTAAGAEVTLFCPTRIPSDPPPQTRAGNCSSVIVDCAYCTEMPEN